jgi:NAD(P)H-flavin reductase
LQWADPKKTSLLLKDGAHFVFGGDSQDKGIGDIRFVKMMLALKEKYPDRVYFIIGNRDANKLRLSTELSNEALKSAIVRTDPTFPYWLAKDKIVTPEMYYTTNNVTDSPVNRLKWLLK